MLKDDIKGLVADILIASIMTGSTIILVILSIVITIWLLCMCVPMLVLAGIFINIAYGDYVELCEKVDDISEELNDKI